MQCFVLQQYRALTQAFVCICSAFQAFRRTSLHCLRTAGQWISRTREPVPQWTLTLAGRASRSRTWMWEYISLEVAVYFVRQFLAVCYWHGMQCVQDAIEKCSALLFFPFLSCHENIDPNPFVASCVSDLCVWVKAFFITGMMNVRFYVFCKFKGIMVVFLIFLCVFRADDEETFCRALVEYTRACSHVGYPVREWRDSFPSCSTPTVHPSLLLLICR